MKILIVNEIGSHYKNIVYELRKNHDVDHLFMDTKFQIDKGDYCLPRLFGFHRGFLLLSYLFTSFLLLTKKYDLCVTDYQCIYFTTIFPIVKQLTKITKTNFIYDIRTIPVDHDDREAKKVEEKFSRKLRFADRYYQGITVITDEMKRYLCSKYRSFKKPVGIWESGVDISRFRPIDKNIKIKTELGFEKDDFVCFYHGAITNKRGIIELVDSFRIIKSRECNIKLFILGGRSYDRSSVDEIHENIRKHNLQDIVRHRGWVDYELVPDLISIADLCVVPLPDIDWWRVSSPLKLMEYIACGKNILLTDMAAHTNFIGRNSNYFWVPEPTPESFAEKIEEAYGCYRDNPHIFYERGMAERERLVDKITWERRSISLQEYFSEITKAEPGVNP